ETAQVLGARRGHLERHAVRPAGVELDVPRFEVPVDHPGHAVVEIGDVAVERHGHDRDNLRHGDVPFEGTIMRFSGGWGGIHRCRHHLFRTSLLRPPVARLNRWIANRTTCATAARAPRTPPTTKNVENDVPSSGTRKQKIVAPSERGKANRNFKPLGGPRWVPRPIPHATISGSRTQNAATSISG